VTLGCRCVQTDRRLHLIEALGGERRAEEEKDRSADHQQDGRDHRSEASEIRHFFKFYTKKGL
jgi:hypothetical protein